MIFLSNSYLNKAMDNNMSYVSKKLHLVLDGSPGCSPSFALYNTGYEEVRLRAHPREDFTAQAKSHHRSCYRFYDSFKNYFSNKYI
jgi:hypothetical protein